jgi:phosphate:Na+ symporter
MLETIAYIFAGLGLYFMGVGGIRTNLQRVPGRKFREFIGHATKVPVLAAGSGFTMGVVTQTSIGVSVILAGLISRGVATIPQALPVVAWSNFGLVVLAYLIYQPVHIIALFLLGTSALYMQFFPAGRFRRLFEPLYALGTLLFGIVLMKHYLPALVGTHEVALIIAAIPGSNFLAFIIGAITRTIIQSTSAVVVLGVILHGAGIFTAEQALMVLFGTGLGTGLAAFFLTSHFKGIMRQITLFEAIINVAAGMIMVIAFYLEEIAHLPLLQYFLGSTSGQLSAAYLANFFLVQQALCLIVTYSTLRWMPHWLEILSPTTVEQDLSRPRFISDEAVQDSETGISLAEREIAGLVQRLPDYLQAVRTEEAEKPVAAPAVLHNAFKAISTELESFLVALSDRQQGNHAVSTGLLRLQHRLSLVGEMENGIWEIVQALRGLPPSGALKTAENNIIEALDALLRTGIEALATNSPDDLEMLGLITAAPGEIVDKLRRGYLREEQTLDHQERIVILSVLAQYERVVWTLHQLSRSALPT